MITYHIFETSPQKKNNLEIKSLLLKVEDRSIGHQTPWYGNQGKRELWPWSGQLGSPPYFVFLLHFSGSGLGSLQSETLEKRNNASLTIIVASNS